MKLRHLLFGLLAGVAFVACTNDNEPAGVTPVKGGNEVAATKYMAINFVMPGDATTRADGGFVVGTTAENKVEKGVLFFFDGETQVADPFILGGEGSNALEGTKLTWSDSTGNVEKKSSTIIVLSNPLKEPKSVLAVLNADLTDLGLSKNSTLSEIKAVVGDYAKDKTAEGKFVMSNSVYQEDVTSPVTVVYDTVEEAIAAETPSAEIYVERVVAKVNVGYADPLVTNLANTDKPSNTVVIDGEEVELTADIQGWWLDNTVDKSFLLKKLPASTDLDAANHRSYWAGSIPTDAKFQHYAFGTATTADKYVQENVDLKNTTKVVVAAILKANGKPLQLVKHLTNLYTESGFVTAAINVLAHKYWVVDKEKSTDTKVEYRTVGEGDFKFTYIFSQVEGEGEAATTKYYTLVNGTKTEVTIPEGVEIPALKSYEAYTLIEIADPQETFYVKDDTTESGYAQKDPTADLKGYIVQKWNDGMAYYFVPIEHKIGGNYTAGTGVIRNHFYKVTVNSINGLGTPVPFKDDDTIIPIKPDETAKYISATINILSWKAVTQDVNLGK